jgi:hypothetical protein
MCHQLDESAIKRRLIFLLVSTISAPPLSYIVDMQSFTVLFALLTTAAVAFAADAHWSPPSSGSHSGSTGSDDHYGSSGAGAGAGGASPCNDPSAGGLGKILDPTVCGVTGTVNKLCRLEFDDLFTHYSYHLQKFMPDDLTI